MLAEQFVPLILSLAGQYDAFVAPATSFGKNVMPRLAARLDVMQVSDITAVVSPNVFKRPIFAGNVIQTIEVLTPKKVITVRSSAFTAAPRAEAAAPVEAVEFFFPPVSSRFVSEEIKVSSRPELTSAKVIVSGGRGVGSAENFTKLIEPLADLVGAGIGASRAAVDSGFASNDWQVGQTGKIVAPELYLAVGISGAIQHLAGMKDSKTIVAINRDAEAPIFGVADYGLVGDLFEVLPSLCAELQKKSA
jgi:electron transfer flavoprotein alpha subunit